MWGTVTNQWTVHWSLKTFKETIKIWQDLKEPTLEQQMSEMYKSLSAQLIQNFSEPDTVNEYVGLWKI